MQEQVNLSLVPGTNINLTKSGSTVVVDCTYDDSSIQEQIDQINQDLETYSTIANTGRYVALELNSTTYELVAKLRDANNNVISTSNTIDLPIESLIMSITYDSTTNELVITYKNGTTLRVPLSDLIDGLVNQTDFDALEVRVDTAESDITDLQESQETQDTAISTLETNLQETQAELDLYKTLYNALPKITGTGESLTLNNTANAVMKNKLYPQIKQATTTGKNIIDTPIRTTTMVKSVNRTEAISFVSGSKTLQAGIYTISVPDLVLSNNNYPLSVQLVGLENNGTALTNKARTITITEEKTFEYLYFYLNSGDNDNATATFSQIMFESGSSATSYEPYTGNQPSPSPSYPQTIHTISGDNTFNFVGKNLLGLGTQLNGYVDTTTLKMMVSQSPSSPSAKSVGYYFKTSQLPNVITFGNIGGNRANVCYFNEIPADGVSTTLRDVSNDNPRTINIDKTYSYVHIQFSYNETNVSNIMVNEGNTLLPYEAYTGTSKPLNLGDLEYNAIGDYKDEFVKVDGKWYLRKNIGKVNIGGFVATEETNVYRYTMNDYLVQNAYSNYFTNVVDDRILSNTTANYYLALEQFSFRTGTKDRMYVKTSLTAEQLNALNPLFYYVSNTPQAITLSETLQNQIEDIYNQTLSYQGQTNISQVNNDLAFIVESSALKDNSIESEGE